MQYIAPKDIEADVENEAATKDLLHRREKSTNVGSLEARRFALATHGRLLRSVLFRYNLFSASRDACYTRVDAQSSEQ